MFAASGFAAEDKKIPAKAGNLIKRMRGCLAGRSGGGLHLPAKGADPARAVGRQRQPQGVAAAEAAHQKVTLKTRVLPLAGQNGSRSTSITGQCQQQGCEQ